MTYQECVIVSAYTGVLMCDFVDMQNYISEKLGEPIWTHELANKAVLDKIKASVKPDFLALCKHKPDGRQDASLSDDRGGYEALIDHLRECAKADPSENTFQEAADAIEKLTRQSRRWELEAEANKNDRDYFVTESRKLASAWINSLFKWIPVEARMPEEPFGCLLIVDDTEPYTGRDFLNYLPYFAGWDGERWNDGDGQQVPFEVRYWIPLPPIPKGEDH